MNRNDISLTSFPFHGITHRVSLDAPTGDNLAVVLARESTAARKPLVFVATCVTCNIPLADCRCPLASPAAARQLRPYAATEREAARVAYLRATGRQP